jgi:hypothetical protein
MPWTSPYVEWAWACFHSAYRGWTRTAPGR